MKMDVSWARKTRSRDRGIIRCGRPRRELAGEVEERILDAAGKVFLERGFEGASVEEIAVVACAGKPTIYARFASKEALFAAVVARKVRKNTNIEEAIAPGATVEERLEAIGSAILERALTPETIGLMRAAVAEARRFPDLASSVQRMARERSTESVAHHLGDLAQCSKMGALPAFASDQLPATARRFVALIFLPLAVRALFGEDLRALRTEIGPHVREAVSFFLAACRHAQPDSHDPHQSSVSERADR